jgi:hypothetical protein
VTTRNDITGDSIRTRVPSQQYKDNWDRIFGKKDTNEQASQEGDWGDNREAVREVIQDAIKNSSS